MRNRGSLACLFLSPFTLSLDHTCSVFTLSVTLPPAPPAHTPWLFLSLATKLNEAESASLATGLLKGQWSLFSAPWSLNRSMAESSSHRVCAVFMQLFAFLPRSWKDFYVAPVVVWKPILATVDKALKYMSVSLIPWKKWCFLDVFLKEWYNVGNACISNERAMNVQYIKAWS